MLSPIRMHIWFGVRQYKKSEQNSDPVYAEHVFLSPSEKVPVDQPQVTIEFVSSYVRQP